MKAAIRSGLVAGIAIGLLATTAPAWARDPSPGELREARELFAKAERDERTGDWRSALAKLVLAGAVKMTPGIRFHIAMCRENLGELVEALADYEAAAAQGRAENVPDVVEASSEPLADLRARVPALSLTLVNAALDAVEITVDGRRVGEAELRTPIRLAAGSHQIVARKRDSGATFSKSIQLKERDVMALDLTLPSETPAPSANGAPLVSQKPVDPASRTTTSPPEELRRRSRTSAVLSTAGAVVLVGGGIGAFLLAGSAQDDLRACTTSAQCEEQRQPVRTWDALALTGFVAGAALGAFATVLWLQPAAPSARTTSIPHGGRLRANIAPTQVSLAGSF